MKYQMHMFDPLEGRMKMPTCLTVTQPFDRCPACEGERDRAASGITLIRYKCGMALSPSKSGDFSVSQSCPYAMAAVMDLRIRRIVRGTNPLPVTAVEGGFKVGDPVRWTSQSAGKETVKHGVVVAVVPADARPENFIPDGMRKNSTNGYGKTRDHVSYLVKVDGKGSMTYWPRVYCLERC